MYEEIIKGILYGAFYGGQAALFGYLKSEDLPLSWKVVFTKDFWAAFDPIKALKTVFLGMAMGALTQGQIYGLIPTDPIIGNFANDVIVIGVDQLMKLIVRRTPLVRVWNALKEKAGKTPLQ